MHDLKVGNMVRDIWFPEQGLGIVKKVLKTRIKIQFNGNLITYDFAHLQFLKKENRPKKSRKKSGGRNG